LKRFSIPRCPYTRRKVGEVESYFVLYLPLVDNRYAINFRRLKIIPMYSKLTLFVIFWFCLAIR